MTIFRVDFGSSVGLGHLMRSLVYAKRFNEVVYISKSNQKEMLPYPLITIQNEEEFFLHVKKLQPKEVVIDNYAFTIEYQKKFKQLFPYIKLSCFDDEYKEYACDEIINHNLGVVKSRYREPHKVKTIPPLIREEFHKLKKKKFQKEGIVLALGGSDIQKLTFKLIKKLRKYKLKVYTTTANKDLKRLQMIKDIQLHINDDIAYGFATSKLAIITPSVTSYEALYMNIPFISITVARNQKAIAWYLKKKNFRVINNIRAIEKKPTRVIEEYYKL